MEVKFVWSNLAEMIDDEACVYVPCEELLFFISSAPDDDKFTHQTDDREKATQVSTLLQLIT